MIVIENVRDFDLDHIFDCGQCFRWDRQKDGSYTGLVRGVPPANISLSRKGALIIDGPDRKGLEEFWREYLDLDRDYGRVKDKLSENDPKMAEVIGCGEGIRILRQDPWETLITFIISQNNNIPRIKKCINSLCENFGKPAGTYGDYEYFDFPDAEVLAGLTLDDLAVSKLGYRAEYIIETAKTIVEEGANKLYSMKGAEREEAFAYLTGLHGVGPKVANCVLLFSLGKLDSFPVDVRICQVMNRVYGIGLNDKRTMAEFAASNFGEYGGVAQQYLYYFIKNTTTEGD